MHIHILGICGTFMGSLALLAQQLGHRVTGSDTAVYPPMSTQLEAQGIELLEGYCPSHLQPAPDLVIIGNALSRGNPAVEYVLDEGLVYTSGPAWLHDELLQDSWVLAVAGTHGKTTTSSILAWLLESAGMSPGFLIGGVPHNFPVSARIGGSPFFVIEADEYDTAFFDKRSKFVHYCPKTLVLNNLEFDHADIFPNLAAIQTQFHHLLRLVPSLGQVICSQEQPALDDVLAQGCWSEIKKVGVGGELEAKLIKVDGSEFEVLHKGIAVGQVNWSLQGAHNVQNALSALAAAYHVGVPFAQGILGLNSFKGVKRRLELLAEIDGVSIYDDFAHHPTAIKSTLEGLRAQLDKEKLVAVIEPASNTMKQGLHKAELADSVAAADQVFWSQPAGLDWSLTDVAEASTVVTEVVDNVDDLIGQLVQLAEANTHIVLMSNSGFSGIQQRLVAALEAK